MTSFTNRVALIPALVSIAVLALAGSARAEDPAAVDGFGVTTFDGKVADGAGGGYSQAGGHPAAGSTVFRLNTRTDPKEGTFWPEEPVKDIVVDLPPGLVGKLSGFPTCSFPELVPPRALSPNLHPLCSPDSQVGVVKNRFSKSLQGELNAGEVFESPVFVMEPPAGIAARFAFSLLSTVVVLDASIRSSSDYGLTIDVHGIPEGVPLNGSEFTFWGVPSDPSHDPERACPGTGETGCSSSQVTPQVFLRNPTSCTPDGVGVMTTMHTDSWLHPGARNAEGFPDLSDPSWKSVSFESHNPPGDLLGVSPTPFEPAPPPVPPAQWGAFQGPNGCGGVPVKGNLQAKPTALDTETPTGLNVEVTVPNPGLENPEGVASSDIKTVEVTLPQGVTINPSQAEGLGVCTPAQYESTVLSFHPTPGKGCPSDSKIGTVNVKTQLINDPIPGEVFIAQQDDPRTSAHGAENPFDSLLALYIVLKNPDRGILVKLPGKVETDSQSGRIVTSFDDLPPVPFEKFEFKFREGARAALVTPPTCGTYTTETVFTPWSDFDHKITSRSDFEILHGIGGGPCPPGGIPPFKPGFSAGSINNNAGSYTPFTMRLTRADGEQNMTKFSSDLAPGLLGKLAGVSKCPDAAVAIAKSKTGRDELASPSCPANSQVGRILGGAGVGSVLTYVSGKVYLGGPYKGAPLSVIVITPAVAGPFDVGTVVVREALTLDPDTAEVHVDGAASDPIPHILQGIPLKLRDLRVYIDRDNFILNPTSCDPSSVKATLFGSFADVFSASDDVPVGLASRFQAANCSSLGFKPKLSINLKGGTKRGGHPGLKAVLNARPGDANIGAATVTLPSSAFLDQAHIRTICTRVQFAAKACPAGAQYGYAKAITPLLDEPIEGPVYLRSSNHKLPDLVAALHGLVDVNVVGRIDSFKGGIRSSFETLPDAPVTKFTLTMQGGKKGLVVNSRNLCAGTNKADARFVGQNGKPHNFKPVVKADCGKGRRGKRR